MSFESVLGASGVKFEDVMESLGEGLILASFEGDLVRWNRAALAMHGYESHDDVKRPIAEFQAIYEFVSLDGRLMPFEEWPLPRLMRGDTVRDLELVLRRKDIEWERVMVYAGSVIRDASGKSVLAVVHVRDATSSRHAELARARDAERQSLLHGWSRRLIEGEPTRDSVAALLVELDRRFSFDVALYYQPSPDGSMGLVESRGIPAELRCRVDPMPTDLAAVLSSAVKLRAFENHPLVTRDWRVLGVLFVASTTRVARKADDRELIETLCHILSAAREREDTLRALHASEAALKDAVDNMVMAQRAGHIGSWEVALDDHLEPTDPIYWSDETFRICGYEPGAIAPTMRVVRDMTHPEDLDKIGLPASESETTQDLRIVRADGSIRHLHMRSRAFPDPVTGKATRRVGTIQDVTERELARAEIETLNLELEARVTQRTAELRAVNAELETFAYSVSHDLRAPLRAIVGFSQALTDEVGSTLTPAAREYLEHIIAGGTRMSLLIDGLLKLSRLSRDGLKKEKVDVTAISREVVESLREEAPGRDVRTDISPGLIVTGDASMLRVVMQNLIANAWKYTSKTADPHVAVERVLRDGRPYLIVRDNGVGFSMSHAKGLFQPFHRLHRQDEFPGLGIGLATVSRIVARHEGTMLADGTPGHGATFGFHIPGITSPHATQASAEASST